MSAKRSFDVQANKPKSAKRAEPKTEKKRSPHPRLSQRAPKRPLRDRRRDEAMRSLTVWGVLTLLVVGAVFYFLWRPEVRISTISAEGIRAEGVEEIALAELRGAYYGVVPRDSFFFYPEHAVRDAVLLRYPEVAALSVGRGGFTTLRLEAVPRVASFHWCGVPESLSAGTTLCYETDAEGLVFASATVPAEEAGMLRVYASLDGTNASDSHPLRARVEGAASLPSVLRFVGSMNGLGIPVASVALRGDEADLFVAPGTRLTYVIGREEEARKNAEAAFPTLVLTDGSVEYVDLRFDGKVYLRRRE